MAYKKRRKRKYQKRRTYKRRKSKSDSADGVFGGIIMLLIILLLLNAWVKSLDTTGLQQLIIVITPLLSIFWNVLLFCAVAYAGWKVWHFIVTIRAREEVIRKTNQKYDVAMAHKTFEHLDWRQFEHFVGKVFTAQGYHVVVTQSSHDKGVDAKLYKAGETYYVQAKFYKAGNNVGGPAVRQMAGTILGVDGGFVVTTSDFTPDAYEAAQTNAHLTLINGAQFRDMIDDLPPEKSSIL